MVSVVLIATTYRVIKRVVLSRILLFSHFITPISKGENIEMNKEIVKHYLDTLFNWEFEEDETICLMFINNTAKHKFDTTKGEKIVFERFVSSSGSS